MSILNHEKILEHISSWIRYYADEHNVKHLIIDGVENYDNYILTKRLCEKSNIDITESPSSDRFVVVGAINKSHIFSRDYDKHTTGDADIYPIADLYHSEVHELLDYLNESYFITELSPSIHLTYEDIEWLCRENIKKNIITLETRPQEYKRWYTYTKHQKEIISRMHQREKTTRHKSLEHRPACFNSLSFVQ